MRTSLATLRQVVTAVPGARLCEPAGGWYASVELDTRSSDEALALALVERGVLVHPGYFFDFARGAWIVVSLLSAPEEVERLSVLGSLA